MPNENPYRKFLRARLLQKTLNHGMGLSFCTAATPNFFTNQLTVNRVKTNGEERE